MNVSMTWQATATLWSVVIGASLGVLYDLFRLSRALVGVRYSDRFSARLAAVRLPLIGCMPSNREPRKRGEFFRNLYVAIGDVIFFLCASVVVTVFLYHINNGILRWYLAAGMIFGFVLYYFSVGKLTVLLSEPFAFAVHSLFRYLAYFTYRPLAFLWRAVRKKMGIVYRKCLNRRRVAAMKKYTKKICNTLDNFQEIV